MRPTARDLNPQGLALKPRSGARGAYIDACASYTCKARIVDRDRALRTRCAGHRIVSQLDATTIFAEALMVAPWTGRETASFTNP